MTRDQPDEKLAGQLPVKSVSDLPGFPFDTHAEFAEAGRKREVLISKLLWLLCRRVIAPYDKREKKIYEYDESSG